MGRSPCCSKVGLKRGLWSKLEDKLLADYIKINGDGNWRKLPKLAGLKRCGRSCRLRWLNYLRPDIKRGNISQDEEDLIIRLHKLLGNRWSLIAGRLPGRTDNEIKNYWNTTLRKGKKLGLSSTLSPSQTKSSRLKPTVTTKLVATRTKTNRCTKVFASSNLTTLEPHTSTRPQDLEPIIELQNHDQNFLNPHITLEKSQFGVECEIYNNQDKGFMEPFNEDILFKDWDFNVACDLEENDNVDFESLSFWLDFKKA